MPQHDDMPTPRPLPPFGYWEYYQELEFLNPTSPETLLKIGHACRLNKSSCVLDVGSGKGTVAILWAQEFGCHVIGVDNLPRMIVEARRRVAQAGLSDRIVFRNLDATDIDAQITDSSDLVCSFGSLFIWGFRQGLQRLINLVAPGGFLAVSDLFFLSQNIDPEFLRRAGYTQDEYPTLAELQECLNILNWEIVKTWEASPKEWQHYLDGTTRALNWYNDLHPGIMNPFVESEKEWAACIKEAGDKWIRFVHAVARERR